jgi:hypothetical protein
LCIAAGRSKGHANPARRRQGGIDRRLAYYFAIASICGSAARQRAQRGCLTWCLTLYTLLRMSTTLTTRDFFRSPRKVARLVQMGRRITVTRAGEAFFDVLPVQRKNGKTIDDFAHLMFSDPNLDRKLSRKVDETVYGKRR